MSIKHPVTPPPELVKKICSDALCGSDGQHDYELRMIHAAYAAGADMELEACVELANEMLQDGNSLRAARRPQPPITRREAISVLDDIDCMFDLPSGHYNTLFRALETLPND